ncbi:hypothetical protein GIB67_020503 [Kingdonia uniflora]|uniref:Bet v I/Major latex protein domain-containing protein n=1 Tax=Kingdonia uniflora TaxID=39325 RepID=A0A7J7PBG3_9MAGN|nr:hypothetical protein GIB67_020503 [Kingdonia uniflora]
MTSGTFSEEFTSPITVARLWKATVVDSHILIPKIAPQFVESINLEGDGGAGTIKTFKFTEAVKEVSIVKNRVDELDQENFSYKYTVIEGNDKYESSAFQIKLEASPEGGSICKISGEYKTVDGHVPTEEESKTLKEGTLKMFKGIETYLIASPDAYA